MKFVYTGEAPNGSIKQYGYTFVPGQMVEVDDPAIAAKLARHQFFKQARRVVEAAEPEPEAPKPKPKPKKAKPGDNGDGGGAG